MEIFVTKACIYKEGRCHGVFNDESSIILHEGGHYCTYFSSKGEITRQVTVCAVGGIKSKLLKLIKLYNSSGFVPIPTFADEIYKVFSKEIKILSSS